MEYHDIPSTHHRIKEISFVTKYGTMVGDENGNFSPDVVLTRAELCVVFCNHFDIDFRNPIHNLHFSDNLRWVEPYVNAISYLPDDWNSDNILSAATTEDFCSIFLPYQEKNFGITSKIPTIISGSNISGKSLRDPLTRSDCAYYIYILSLDTSNVLSKTLLPPSKKSFHIYFSFRNLTWLPFNFSDNLSSIVSFLRTPSTENSAFLDFQWLIVKSSWTLE